jgi:hypothetical protein
MVGGGRMRSFLVVLCFTNFVLSSDCGHTGPAAGLPYQGNPIVARSQISPETEKRIGLLFPPDEHELVRAILLEECGNNLPFLQDIDEVALERFRFAALKLSEGKLDKLDHAIALAKSDWRDLLTAAGFGRDVNAHWAWLPERKYG